MMQTTTATAGRLAAGDTLPAFATPISPRRRWLAWLIALLVIPVAFMALMKSFEAPAAVDEIYRITWAQRVAHDGVKPPPTDTAAAPVIVPYYDDKARGELYSSWYVIEPTAAQRAGDRLALYVPRPFGNIRVFIDGVHVAGYARTTVPPSHHVLPLLLTLPERALAAPSSRLLVNSLRFANGNSLPEMFLGPVDAVEPAWQRLWWIKAGSVRIAILLACCLALLTLAFYALRPVDRAYAWFAAVLVFWVLHIVRDHIVDIPVARPLWTTLTTAALSAFVACSVVFLHRYVGRQPRRAERVLMIVLVLGNVANIVRAALFGWGYSELVLLVWIPLVNLLGLVNLYTLIRAAREVPALDRFALLAAAMTTTLVGLRDFIYDLGIIQPSSLFYLGHAMALVVLVFGAIVVRRFAQAVSESERLNRELARRVADKSREIEANHARVRELENEQARRRERERIMREVHDGIGGQLVQGLAVAERSGDPQVLREVFETCLADLRLMVDAVDAGDADIVNLLARFRHRIGKRLEAAGVELDWRISDLPPSALHPGQAVHVLRILQEGFANALRHSGAHRITVSTGLQPEGAIWIEVRDDGRGIAATSRGHGLDNMRARAAQIGGELAIESGAGGTAIRLLLPAAARRQELP